MKKYFEKVYRKDISVFYDMLKNNLIKEKKTFIITANPEAFMMGKTDIEFNKAMMDKNTIVVADGMGVSKGAKILKYNVASKIPGVDIATKLFDYCNELKKSIYLYGSKQEVIDAMVNVLKRDYPNIVIKGAKNGYSKDKDKDFIEISKTKPDIVLVALGMGTQEKLIYSHLKDFKKGIFVGVGGTFDVLSGTKKRAPKFFQKFNIEWLYRIVAEPSRFKRFYNSNIKFMFMVFRNKNKWKNTK